MSGENRAAFGLRVTQVAAQSGIPGEDLTSFNATEYPDGALVYVNAQGILYRLDKSSALPVQSNAVIDAIGGGQWIAQVGSAVTLYAGSVRLDESLTTPSTGALTQNIWTALPTVVANGYLLDGSSIWTLPTTTGVLTYNGPTRSFAVFGSISGFIGTGTAATIAFSFQRSNSVIIGTPTNQDIESREEILVDIENTWNFSGLVANIADGQTIQGVVRNVTGTEAFEILRYNLTLIPV